MNEGLNQSGPERARRRREICAIAAGLIVLGIFACLLDRPKDVRETKQSGANPLLANPHKVADFMVKSGLGGKRLAGVDEALPSAKRLTAEQHVTRLIKKGLPVLALNVDEVDLFDEDSGLFTHPGDKGIEWEKPCHVRYYNNGRLLFDSEAGVRVHGGTSRGMEIKSLRLYFRQRYGAAQFPEGVLFDGEADPVRHLIVRNAERGGFFFLMPLAFQMSRKIGCYTPASRPVKVSLNGRIYGHGNFEMVEHLSRQYVETHFGHDDFVMVRTKDEEVAGSYKKLLREMKVDEPLTINEAGEIIDMDNFMNWWVSQLFLANTDPFQGLALLDQTRSDAKWFWVNWDMDHAIRNHYEMELEHGWEQKRELDRVLVKVRSGSVRAAVFKRLHKYDPDFKEVFVRRFMNALNHELTPAYLRECIDEYARWAEEFEVEDKAYIQETRLFMEHRPDFVRQLLSERFDAGEWYRCTVEVPAGMTVEIDGYPSEVSYSGWYFEGSELMVTASEPDRDVQWMVNGEPVGTEGRTLTHVVKSEARIVPVVTPKPDR